MQDDEGSQEEWGLAVELAVMPEVWRTLLEQHVGGRDGRCRGCHSQVRTAPHWPCTLYRAAAQARRIAAVGPRLVEPPPASRHEAS